MRAGAADVALHYTLEVDTAAAAALDTEMRRQVVQALAWDGAAAASDTLDTLQVPFGPSSLAFERFALLVVVVAVCCQRT